MKMNKPDQPGMKKQEPPKPGTKPVTTAQAQKPGTPGTPGTTKR